jgi:hypothetical protein
MFSEEKSARVKETLCTNPYGFSFFLGEIAPASEFLKEKW